MQVNGTSNQMQMQQMQMGKMQGQGGGHGKGMGAIMQSLPQEDRQNIREQLQNMSETDRMSAIEQIKQLDSASMSSKDLTSSILDILNPEETETSSSKSVLDLYA